MTKPRGSIFLLVLLALTLLFALIAWLWPAQATENERAGALAGVVAAAVSAALSFALLARALGAPNLSFMRAYFLGMLLRALFVAIAALAVWGWWRWSLSRYLIAVALSYPFFLFLEAWRMSRLLAERKTDSAPKES